jgi:RNA polymerase sigma-70 factor (ECF subfamily)
LRRRAVERRVLDFDADVDHRADRAEAPPAQMIASERTAVVRQAVAHLDDIHRIPLVLRYYSEMSYAQIAELLGTNRDVVGVRIHRAKSDLRRALSKARREGRL